MPFGHDFGHVRLKKFLRVSAANFLNLNIVRNRANILFVDVSRQTKSHSLLVCSCYLLIEFQILSTQHF